MHIEIELLKVQAEEALQRYQEAAGTHAQAVQRRQMAEHEKPLQKDAAIQRAMQGGEGQVKQTYTAAERTVEADPEYRQFLADYRDLVRIENLAFADMMSRRMQFDLALALLQVSGREMVRMPEVTA